MSLLEAVDAALAAEPIAPTDAAVVDLCRIYADQIDEDLSLVKDLGPKLLAALEALQLSPRARALARVHGLNGKAAPDGNEQPNTAVDQLAAIRSRRRKRNA